MGLIPQVEMRILKWPVRALTQEWNLWDVCGETSQLPGGTAALFGDGERERDPYQQYSSALRGQPVNTAVKKVQDAQHGQDDPH